MATAAETAAAIRAALSDLAPSAAVVSVSIDGITTSYSQGEARRALDYWERRAARESGARPISASIKLSGF
jgi:hypothetical protein